MVPRAVAWYQSDHLAKIVWSNQTGPTTSLLPTVGGPGLLRFWPLCLIARPDSRGQRPGESISKPDFAAITLRFARWLRPVEKTHHLLHWAAPYIFDWRTQDWEENGAKASCQMRLLGTDPIGVHHHSRAPIVETTAAILCQNQRVDFLGGDQRGCIAVQNDTRYSAQVTRVWVDALNAN